VNRLRWTMRGSSPLAKIDVVENAEIPDSQLPFRQPVRTQPLAVTRWFRGFEEGDTQASASLGANPDGTVVVLLFGRSQRSPFTAGYQRRGHAARHGVDRMDRGKTRYGGVSQAAFASPPLVSLLARRQVRSVLDRPSFSWPCSPHVLTRIAHTGWAKVAQVAGGPAQAVTRRNAICRGKGGLESDRGPPMPPLAWPIPTSRCAMRAKIVGVTNRPMSSADSGRAGDNQAPGSVTPLRKRERMHLEPPAGLRGDRPMAIASMPAMVPMTSKPIG
jgi:hypothetical protein